MIDMHFFRAAAAVIPTLLIAVVFTGRVMDTFQLDLEKTSSKAERLLKITEYLSGITFVSWLLFAAIVGQGAALAAIVCGNPHVIYLLLVLGAIVFLLTSLAGTVLAHAIGRLDDAAAKQAAGSYVIVVVGLVLFLGLILSAAFAPETVARIFG